MAHMQITAETARRRHGEIQNNRYKTRDAVGAVLEVLITERSPTKWEWRVCDRHGTTIMGGFERTRPAARYRGNRALFLMLARGYNLREDRRGA